MAEKILQADEQLPDWWAVSGSTGYDFLASVNGLFVDRGASRQLTAIHGRFIGARPIMADVIHEAKRLIMQTTMASEISELGLTLDHISETNRLSRDFTRASLTRAIREVSAAFPVYRTYVGDRGVQVSPRDRAYIERAVAEARRRNRQLSASVFDFVRDTLLLRAPDGAPETERRARLRFVMRFQQTTGPVTAKGVEDTAFYRDTRLVSLNEVGGDPRRFGEPPAAFHAKNAERLRRWPESLLATSTHDTKRGEDVRARINVLSEVPGEWQEAVRRWHLLTRRLRRPVDGRAAPDRNDEYLLYQTLVGAWPLDEGERASGAFVARMAAYMEKATREAKVRTGWIDPDAEYDDAVREFVSAVLAPDSPTAAEIGRFALRVARHGMVNSLGQTVLKIAAPGVPDFYQGAERWDLSLVDPDNRRPVDWVGLQQMLGALRARAAAPAADLGALCDELLEAWTDARIKLYVIHRALGLAPGRPRPLHGRRLSGARRDRPARRARGRPGPGGRPPRRRRGRDPAVRAPGGLRRTRPARPGGVGRHAARRWGTAAWPERYRDVFTGRRLATDEAGGDPGLAMAEVLGRLPVALLVREGHPA